MTFLADLHIHSKYARATSKDLDPEHLAFWGALKGLSLLATGDCVHALEGGEGYRGTVEFFPEEGKHHMDGHRACEACLTPEETAKKNGLCPICGKPLTIGIAHRVNDLADRPPGAPPRKKRRKPIAARSLPWAPSFPFLPSSRLRRLQNRTTFSQKR